MNEGVDGFFVFSLPHVIWGMVIWSGGWTLDGQWKKRRLLLEGRSTSKQFLLFSRVAWPYFGGRRGKGDPKESLRKSMFSFLCYFCCLWKVVVPGSGEGEKNQESRKESTFLTDHQNRDRATSTWIIHYTTASMEASSGATRHAKQFRPNRSNWETHRQQTKEGKGTAFYWMQLVPSNF